MDKLAKNQYCQLLCEQEIQKAIASGKTNAEIGRGLSALVKNVFDGLTVDPRTFERRARRARDSKKEFVTPVPRDFSVAEQAGFDFLQAGWDSVNKEVKTAFERSIKPKPKSDREQPGTPQSAEPVIDKPITLSVEEEGEANRIYHILLSADKKVQLTVLGRFGSHLKDFFIAMDKRLLPERGSTKSQCDGSNHNKEKIQPKIRRRKNAA